MNGKTLLWIAGGVALLLTAMALVWGINKTQQIENLERVNKEQIMQFQNMRVAQQNIARDLATLKAENEALERSIGAVRAANNRALDAIAKLKKDKVVSHAQIDSLDNDAVNAYIVDGLSKYHDQQRATGEDPDRE